MVYYGLYHASIFKNKLYLPAIRRKNLRKAFLIKFKYFLSKQSSFNKSPVLSNRTTKPSNGVKLVVMVKQIIEEINNALESLKEKDFSSR